MQNKKVMFLAASLFLVAMAASAQSLKPFTALRVLRTDHFDIIFPEESRRSAEALASFADQTYARIAYLLGSEVEGRIPVTITPHTDVFNGYMNPVPYPHIVLYDTPMNVEWTTYRRSLEGLFVHELTHVFSLTIRGPFFDFLHGIFGSWVLPATLNAPMFMVEGVTVSFESLEGFGRANDPAVKQRIRQAIHEGTFLDPFQASGVYDKPPLGAAYYEYGGLFSAYLQRRFGMEKYAELWRELGTRIPLTILFSRHYFAKTFSTVYGIDLYAAWADFAASLAVDGLEENDAGLIAGGESLIKAIAAGGGRVFFLDRVALAVTSFDPRSGKLERVVSTDATSYDLDVSEDGSRLIVAGYRYAGELGRAAATEYDTATGNSTGRAWFGLYKPRYFRDGVVALASDLHDNRLVYRDASGAEQVLLAGNEERLFSAPAPLDDDRIAFIVAERGVRRLGVYDFRTATASLLATDLDDDEERWRYARDLRFSGGKLYLSFDHDDRFYKLAKIDLDAGEPTVLFASRDLSGGIQAPVEVAGGIYYRAAFSTWDALMRYPEAAEELQGLRSAVRLETWPDAGSERGNAAIAENTAVAAEADSGTAVFSERGYNPLGYLNPFRLWLPLPLLRLDDETFRLDGGGAVFYLSTPTDMNTALLSVGGDAREKMGYFDLNWMTYNFFAPSNVHLSDKIEFDSGEGFDSPYRATRASGQLFFTRGLGGERLRLSIAPGAEAVWLAPEEEGESSAYAWDYLEGAFSTGVAIGLSTWERLPWRLFGRGSVVTARYRFSTPADESRWDGIFRFAAEPALPLRATLYGAWDEGGQDLDGHTKRYGTASFSSAAVTEYAGEVDSLRKWVAGGEIELRIFSVELQRSFSYLYFNRLFGVLSWRGAAYDAEGVIDPSGLNLGDRAALVHSVVAKAGTVASFVPAGFLSLRYSPFFWAALKLSNLGDGEAGNDFAFGFSLAVEW